MEADIKCMVCEKMTRHFELGQIFYNINNASETVIVKNPIICPKCNKDISKGKCLIKSNYLLIGFVAANISLKIENETGDPIPEHLRGATPLKKEQYNEVSKYCKARPKLVDQF